MAKAKETTLRCVTTLAVIAVVCALLLSVLNSVLYVSATPDDLIGLYSAVDGYEWEVVDVNDDQPYSGGKVILVAKGTMDGKDDYLGLLVQTEKNGKLNESTYAMFINMNTDALEYAAFVTEGATGGFNWQYAKEHSKSGDQVSTGATALTGLLSGDRSNSQAAWREWESFYGVITDQTALDYTDAVPAKTGATRTVTATYDAFNIVARYYYDNFVKGE